MPTIARRKPSSAAPAVRASNRAYAARIDRLREACADDRADSALITNARDVAYFTGFSGGDSYLFVPSAAGERAQILSDFRYEEELEPVRPLADVVIRSGGMLDATVAMLKIAKVRRCAVRTGSMSVSEHVALEKGIGKGRLVAMPSAAASMRDCKDAHEIALIRHAISIQEKALKVTLPQIKIGMSEIEVAAIIEYEMKRRGSSAPSFESLVGAGANGSLPHYRPATEKIRAGSMLLIDWGATYGGYHGDLTRTFAIRSWPRTMREVYQIVLEAHEAAAEALRPGVTGKSVDAAARVVITAAGYGERFGHGLGHGLGLDVHENPRLSHMVDGGELVPGNIVTIEPGIYLPGIGGVRLEDDYLVTKNGCERLSTLPKSASWALLDI